MTIKDFGAQVVSVWNGLRPVTKKMLSGETDAPSIPNRNFYYDAHADWELSQLLSVLDEQAKDKAIASDAEKLREIKQLSETCVRVLESQTESAEVFIQLAERALVKRDYQKIDALADILVKRFPVLEIAEIVRQTEMPQIRALAFESLSMKPTSALEKCLDDPYYFVIIRDAIEHQAFEFESYEARILLDRLEMRELFEE